MGHAHLGIITLSLWQLQSDSYRSLYNDFNNCQIWLNGAYMPLIHANCMTSASYCFHPNSYFSTSPVLCLTLYVVLYVWGTEVVPLIGISRNNTRKKKSCMLLPTVLSFSWFIDSKVKPKTCILFSLVFSKEFYETLQSFYWWGICWVENMNWMS